MIMDTHCFPSVHITINIQHRHDNEIHLVQHLCHAWVFSIFWDNLKMNKDTLSHNTQIRLSRTAAKYIFGWSYQFSLLCSQQHQRFNDIQAKSCCLDRYWHSQKSFLRMLSWCSMIFKSSSKESTLLYVSFYSSLRKLKCY